MAAVVHIVKPPRESLFLEYTQLQLLPYHQNVMTNNTTRVNAVWDTYVEASQKFQTRVKRGQTAGLRTLVAAKIPLPKRQNWKHFLTDSRNKDDLFKFLSDELQRNTLDSQYHLFTIKGELVLSNNTIDLMSLSPCQQEEADTRMMLHLRHSVEQGHTKAYLRTVDSDVVVLAVNFFKELGFTELWIGLCTGKSYKDSPIYEITQMLGTQHCTVLPFVMHSQGAMLFLRCLELTRRLHEML